MDQHRNLEITLISAKGLQKLNLLTKMDVYATAEISGGPKGSKQKTQVDKDADANPTWNFPMKFTVDESALQQNRLTLAVKLKSEGILGDKDIGEVHVPLKELVDGSGKDMPVKFVSYQVRKPSGKPKGELYFSYKFGEVAAQTKITGVEKPVTAYPMMDPGKKADEQPVTAYPMMDPGKKSDEHPVTAYPTVDHGKKGDEPPVTAYPMVGSSSGHPPPPQSYQYPYPPPPGAAYGGAYPPPSAGGYYPPPSAGGYYPPPSGYPPPPQSSGYPYQQPPPYGGYPPPPPGGYPYPPQPGYGYPPPQQVQQPKKKNKMGGMGMGLGAGLLGGALGGLIIGDMISDATDGGGCGGGCGGF